MADDDGVRPPARLRDLTSWQVSKASTLGSRLTARRMPLSARSDFAVLAALEEYGPLSQAEIGRRLALDRNDVNGVLNRLQEQGRVRREVDGTDRRRNVVTLTRDGRAHLGQLQEHADAVQAELLEGLTAPEQRQLRRLLAKLLDAHPAQSA